MITVCQLDGQGYYVGHAVAHESPLEPGVFHIPRLCVNVPVPVIPEGCVAKYNAKSNAFDFEEIPVAPTPEPVVDPLEDNAQYQTNKLLDSVAREFGYDGMMDAATYVTSKVARYASEASALVSWRDQVWDYVETKTTPSDLWGTVKANLPKAPVRASA